MTQGIDLTLSANFEVQKTYLVESQWYSIVFKIINLALAYGRKLHCNTTPTDNEAKLFISNAIYITVILRTLRTILISTMGRRHDRTVLSVSLVGISCR